MDYWFLSQDFFRGKKVVDLRYEVSPKGHLLVLRGVVEDGIECLHSVRLASPEECRDYYEQVAAQP